jgi:hypothetical protein
MFSNPRASCHAMNWHAIRESASLPKEVKGVLASFADEVSCSTCKQ